MIEKRYVKENFYDEYAIKKEDTIIAIVDSGTNARKICNELNALHDENKQLKQEMWDLGTAHAEEINKIEDKFDEEILKLEKENEQLKSKLISKEDLIQQLKNELNSDCYKKSRKYLNEFIRVCEELAEINQDYKKILEENKALKERNEFLELLTTHRGEMVSMANSIIQDLSNTPTVKAQEMWYEFKEEMYQEWKKQRGIG